MVVFMSSSVFSFRIDADLKVKCDFLIAKSGKKRKEYFAELINNDYEKYDNSDGLVSELQGIDAETISTLYDIKLLLQSQRSLIQETNRQTISMRDQQSHFSENFATVKRNQKVIHEDITQVISHIKYTQDLLLNSSLNSLHQTLLANKTPQSIVEASLLALRKSMIKLFETSNDDLRYMIGRC